MLIVFEKPNLLLNLLYNILPPEISITMQIRDPRKRQKRVAACI